MPRRQRIQGRGPATPRATPIPACVIVQLNRDVRERYRRAANASRESPEQLGARIGEVSKRDEDRGTAQFDAFVGGLDYPVFVVTAAHGEERSGCLVGFATQASIDPPRMLV